jgi:MFS superfamily sulfate permease-like transporter
MKDANDPAAIRGGAQKKPRFAHEWLQADVLAGVISAAVVVPKAMAYATIAGLPVQVGLYFSAMPAGGGTTQMAVNRHAGAKSQLAELVTAASALAILLLFAPLIAFVPQAALAPVVVAHSIGLVQRKEFRAMRAVRTMDFRWALFAIAGVVLLGTLKGILVAAVVSLVALAYQAYSPTAYALGRKRWTTAFWPLSKDHPDDEQWPGLLLVRVEGRVLFCQCRANRRSDLTDDRTG